MKFLHLADLHLGKRVNGFDLLEDQRYILEQVLALCDEHDAEAVLLAGADGYKPGTPAYADSLLHAHTGRGAAFNTAMAGAIKACGLDVTFITPSEYAK